MSRRPFVEQMGCGGGNEMGNFFRVCTRRQFGDSRVRFPLIPWKNSSEKVEKMNEDGRNV